jgi:hypothetical protein
MIDRRYIDELCAEHDRLMAEAQLNGYWTPPQKRPTPVVRQKAAPVVLDDNSAPIAPAPVSTIDEPALVAAIGAALARERKLAREAREKEIAPLQTEIAELRGQVTALLTLLGRKDGEGKVIDLPQPAWRRGA